MSFLDLVHLITEFAYPTFMINFLNNIRNEKFIDLLVYSYLYENSKIDNNIYHSEDVLFKLHPTYKY